MGRADLPFEAKVNVVYCKLRGLSKYWVWKQPLRTTSTGEGPLLIECGTMCRSSKCWLLECILQKIHWKHVCVGPTKGNVSWWGNKTTNTNVITKLFLKAPGFFVHTANISCVWNYIGLFQKKHTHTTNFTFQKMNSVRTQSNNCVVTFQRQKGRPRKAMPIQSWLMTATASLLIDAWDTVEIFMVLQPNITHLGRRETFLRKK